MRDILLTLIVFGFIPFIFIRPYVGALVWTWLGFMSPHGLTFGFAYEMPYSKIIGIVTMIALLMYKDKSLPRSSMILWLFLLYVFWSTVTTMFAIYPDDAMEQWGEFMKKIIMMLVILIMTNNRQKLNALIAVVVFSIGFFGFKGGIFTIQTAGSLTVWGPPLSFMSDNNALGLALVMTMPLMWYLQSIADRRWIKLFMLVTMVLTVLAILGTQSRGAFLGVVAMTGFMVMKSRAKYTAALGVILLAPILYTFMPQGWHERMETIKNYEQDESAMMRINAWEFAINLANDHPVTGGGYSASTEEMFSIYSERPEIEWTGPHSIYFETLGDHGWVGLAIFLLMGLTLYRSLGYIMKQTKGYEDLLWMRDLAAMCQVSVVGYAVSGAFLELAKFDLYFMLIVIASVMFTILKNRMDEDAVSIEEENKYSRFMNKHAKLKLKGAV